MKSVLLDEKLLGLVEMTSGLVNASFSLPEWQVVKMIFFAPWSSWPFQETFPEATSQEAKDIENQPRLKPF